MNYSSLTVSLQQSIADSLLQTLPAMNAQGISNTLYGLGCLKMPMSSVSVVLREKLYTCTQQQLHQMVDIGLAGALNGLAAMGATAQPLTDIIDDIISHRLHNMSARALANVCHS